VEAGDGLDEMAEGAAEPVEAPDDECVPGPQLRDGLLEAAAIGKGA
jgi:hypothetical protein